MARFSAVAVLALIVFLFTYFSGFSACAFPSLPILETRKVVSESVSNSLSIAESFGFFEESDSRWFLRKLIHSHQAAAERSCQAECFHLGEGPCVGRKWWQLHLEPSFSCSFERRIGPIGAFGKWVCNPHQVGQVRDGCLVYSFRGVANTFEFETALRNERRHCEIHVFGNASQVVPPPFIQYHVKQVGGVAPLVDINQIAKELGHTGRNIDILNIDCHGCEWDRAQYSGWFHDDVFVRQLLVRLTWPFDYEAHGLHPGLGDYLTTPKDPPPEIPAFLLFLQSKGFVVTHKEFDTARCGGNCVEMTFLRLHDDFARSFLALPTRACWDSRGPVAQEMLNGTFRRFQVVKESLSWKESFGYIGESDVDWQRRKQIHKEAMDLQLKISQVLQRYETSHFDPGDFFYYNPLSLATSSEG
ncbi:unnamed protein product [Durusdinium trenchii]|uniref:Methyltransferase domain-containing protein n=1 Tax=Durusdinium trenchii TaxID=1381693 RepID=A0ABP0T020_9DINO